MNKKTKKHLSQAFKNLKGYAEKVGKYATEIKVDYEKRQEEPLFKL